MDLIDEMGRSGFKTKLRIVRAIEELISDKPLERLRIQDICAAAGIGRSTFYSHFHDKYEALQWHLDMCFDSGFTQIGRTLTWMEGHLITSEAIAGFPNLERESIRANDYNAPMKYTMRRHYDILAETITEYKKHPLTPLLRFQIAALAAAEGSAVHHLLSSGDRLTPQTKAEYLTSIVPHDLFKLLNVPAIEVPADQRGMDYRIITALMRPRS